MFHCLDTLPGLCKNMEVSSITQLKINIEHRLFYHSCFGWMAKSTLTFNTALNSPQNTLLILEHFHLQWFVLTRDAFCICLSQSQRTQLNRCQGTAFPSSPHIQGLSSDTAGKHLYNSSCRRWETIRMCVSFKWEKTQAAFYFIY